MNVTITLVEVECHECHTTFAITSSLEKQRRAERKTFYCPLGHALYYPGETEVQLLKRQLDAAKADATFYRGHMESAERSLRATRGVVTKLRKRAEAGVCPFGCRRHFVDMERHVASKHAGQVMEGES